MAVGSIVAPLGACRPVRVAVVAVPPGIGMMPAVIVGVARRVLSTRVGVFGVIVGITLYMGTRTVHGGMRAYAVAAVKRRNRRMLHSSWSV